MADNIAYFDCFSGASGDMILAAMLDAGLGLDDLRADLEGLAVEGYRLDSTRVNKQGFAATRVDVRLAQDAPQAHRHLHDILTLIDKSRLDAKVKAQATRIFRRLGEAEARVHGTSIESVHFHEVGAVDAIVDIVGACIGLARLDIDRVVCSAIPTCGGTVTCAHGVLPVPAPATAVLLEGVPLASCDEPAELTTPTGAAILTTLAESFGPIPPMIWKRAGYGAGSRDGITRPNLLRVVLGTSLSPETADCVTVLEANLDDAPAEWIGFALERLLAAGALDAYCVPITMKKSRPGVLLTVLCEPGRVVEMENILFAETTTLGIRRYTAQRSTLQRRFETVETAYGPVVMKIASRGGAEVTAAPEYEDCRRAAEAQGVALRKVMAAAEHAWRVKHG